MTEETLFQEALSRSPEERAAFLDQACAGRPDLLAAVEALLAAHAMPGNLLDQPAADLGQAVDPAPGQVQPIDAGEHAPQREEAPPPQATTTDYRPNAGPGTVIAGRYALLERLGEGGMGEVWVARQTAPVKRRVALKLIKAGMDSRAVLQRFEQERQALAMMDHPNIAKVLDGGLTSDRRPYFVMELVNGLPLTKFCDDARLTPRERLELFVPICQAVQHAHQKGIVHRDLKPSNILVTLYDGRPVPKVIDFGVAKAVGGKLTDESLATQFGAVVGTLEYMAPEQAGYSALDVDTRADIYSLGVILYELLTGLRPFDSKRLRKAALDEVIRIIREEEPPGLAARLSTDDSLPSVAAARQTEPKRLVALIRGEPDWIVRKCLEKDRNRRYETASGLGRDIQRYLADEPVEARPVSAGYRLRKFVRRHRPQVIVAALILFALVAGMIGTTFGLFEARKQRDAADAARENEGREKDRAVAAERLASERLAEVTKEQERAGKAETVSKEEAAIAKAVNDFLLKDLLQQADPSGACRPGQEAGRGRCPAVRRGIGVPRPEPAPAEEARRGGADHPRLPRHPREEGARRLADLQHEVDARRRPAGPEELRGRRAALAGRLRGDEEAGRQYSPRGRAATDRGPRAAGATLRSEGRASRGGEMAKGTGHATGGI
jgi:tRNA A-37 threonylcarbamoyl transferase component Bud32